MDYGISIDNEIRNIRFMDNRLRNFTWIYHTTGYIGCFAEFSKFTEARYKIYTTAVFMGEIALTSICLTRLAAYSLSPVLTETSFPLIRSFFITLWIDTSFITKRFSKFDQTVFSLLHSMTWQNSRILLRGQAYCCLLTIVNSPFLTRLCVFDIFQQEQKHGYEI